MLVLFLKAVYSLVDRRKQRQILSFKSKEVCQGGPFVSCDLNSFENGVE